MKARIDSTSRIDCGDQMSDVTDPVAVSPRRGESLCPRPVLPSLHRFSPKIPAVQLHRRMWPRAASPRAPAGFVHGLLVQARPILPRLPTARRCVATLPSPDKPHCWVVRHPPTLPHCTAKSQKTTSSKVSNDRGSSQDRTWPSSRSCDLVGPTISASAAKARTSFP